MDNTLPARLPPLSPAVAADCHLIIQPCIKCTRRSALVDRRRVFWQLLLLDPGLRNCCTVDLSKPHKLVCVTVSGRLHAVQMDRLLRYVQSSYTCYRTFGVAMTGITTEAHIGAMIDEWSEVAGSAENDGAAVRAAAIKWDGIFSTVGVWLMRRGETCGQTIDGGLFGMLTTNVGLQRRYACNRCSQLETTSFDIVRHLLQAHGQRTGYESPDRLLALSPKGETTRHWLSRLMDACCCGRSGLRELDD